MPRIVAGAAGGRRLRVPTAGTRPTSDRVREALFNILTARLDFGGIRVLDLYAGSGALGLEALSRGASHAEFVELDRRAVAVLKSNIAELSLSGTTVRQLPVATALARGPEAPVDLVFSDPPYALSDSDVAADLVALLDHGRLLPGAIVVVERSSRSPEPVWPAGFVVDRSRTYGETRIALAARETE